MRSKRFRNSIWALLLSIAMTAGILPVYADTTGNTDVSAYQSAVETSENDSSIEGTEAGNRGTDSEVESGTTDSGAESIDTDSGNGSTGESKGDESLDGTTKEQEANPDADSIMQALTLDELAVTGADAAVSSGYYTIYSGISSSMVLEIGGGYEKSGAAANIYTSNNSYAQSFYITNLGGGLYTIRNCNSDMLLGVSGTSVGNTTAVGQYAAADSNSQKWYITKSATSGYYTISSALNKNMVLDVYGGYSANSTKVQLYTSNNSRAQLWKLGASTNSYIKTLSAQSVASIQDGYYTMISGAGSGMALDIYGGYTTNGANVGVFKSNSSEAQSFRIQSVGGGLYKVINLKSGKALDVYGGNTSEGTNIWQYTYNGTKAQLWYITKSGTDGYYTFRSALGNKVMTAEGTSNLSNVGLHRFVDSSAQKWKINYSDANISTGYYTIESKVQSGMVLDVYGGLTADGTDINIYASNGTAAQEFYVSNLGGGVYKIETSAGNKVIDVYGGQTANNTLIQQYSYNGTNAQKWYITRSADGYVTIRSVLNSEKVLNVDGGKTANNTDVVLYDYNGTNAQAWKLNGVSKTVANGIYTIQSALSSSKVIDIYGGNDANCTNVQIYSSNSGHAQKFYIYKQSNGYYKIINIGSRKALDVAGGAAKNSTNVWLYSANSSAAQDWSFTYLGGGNYRIDSRIGNYCLDVAGGLTTNGTNVQIYTPNGSNAQKFTLSATSATITSGSLYTIRSKADPAKVLDVYGGSLANSANVQIYASNSTNAQKWFITKSGNYYSIVSAASGKALDIYGGYTADGTNVWQYTANSSTAQKWSLVDTGDGDGSYYIVSASGKYLDVATGSTANGTNVQIYTGNKSTAQKFYICETSKNNTGFYTTGGNTYYYSNGTKLTGFQIISGVRYYFNSSGVMARSTTIDGYSVDADGKCTLIRNNTVSAGKTIKSFLSNALKPVGSTLYIWGGGWSSGENGSVRDASIVGIPSSWETFFNAHATQDYDYTNYKYSYGNGLDCSGFVGWALYNTINSTNNGQWTVYQSSTVASTYAAKGWTQTSYNVANPDKFYPGDVVSMDGHVWISLGQCSDGSVVVLHSSPKGVQISGTVVPSTGSSNSQAYTLAKKYMAKYYPQWPYATRCVSLTYIRNLKGVAHWKTSGGLLSDPDGMQSKSAEQVLQTLLGSV